MTPAPQTQSRHTGYHPDSYVVTVASSQTPCFGAFSSHGSSVCSDCPLRRECQAKMYSTLSTLAVKMKAGKVKVPKAKGKDKADGTTTPAADDGTGTPLDWSDPTSIDELVAVAEAPCGLCGKPVKAGEHAYWSTKDNGYLYHIDCGNRSKP